MAVKGKTTTQKKNTASNVATQKQNSATMAARYSTPTTTTSKSTNTSATKNKGTTSVGSAVSNAVKTATNAASSAVKSLAPSNTSSLGSSIANAIKTPVNAVASSFSSSSPSSSSSSSKSSTTSSANKGVSVQPVKYVDPVKQEADKQKAANETYVNNLLGQLKNQAPATTAKGLLDSVLQKNMSPSQQTTAMLNAMSGLTGVGLGTGLPSPAQRTANRALLDYLATQTEKPSADLDELYSGDADAYAQSVMNNANAGALLNQTTNAMQGDPRYQTPTKPINTLQDALQNAVRDTLVESVNNPNSNAPFIETPSALIGQPTYDAVVNPMSPTAKETLGSNLYHAFGSLGNAMLNAAENANPYSPLATKAGQTASSAPNALMDALANAFNGIANRDTDAGVIGSGQKGTGNVYNTSSTSSSRSGRGGGGSGSGAALGDGNIDISILYDLLNQRLGEYDANFNEMMQALMDSYNMNFGNIDDAYAAALERLGLNYADTEALLNSSLANSQKSLEDDRERALQEAYIARMMQEKNLADQLDAYGLTGGATESVLADMRNNYNNNRNSIESKVQESLRDLLQQYMTNLSDARQKYNSQLLDAETSRLNAAQNLANQYQSAQNDVINARSQQRSNAYEDLYNTLANLTMKGINYV